MGERIDKRRGVNWLSLALFFGVFLAALLLTSKVDIYCDDYWYGMFLRDGWKKFWELTSWHYLNFNGRAFVHFVAELVLIFDTKLFTLLNPLMLTSVFLLGGWLQNRSVPKPALLATGAAGLFAFLSLPVSYLNTSIFWISAAFNYLFPLSLILITFWLYQRDMDAGKLRVLTLVLAFLSGATTEQSGVAAIICLGGWGFLSWLRKETPLLRGALPGVLSCIGYLTIIFAPGTWVRISNETGGGLLSLFRPDVFFVRLRRAMEYITGEYGVPAMFFFFAIATAVHALITKKGSKILLSGFLAGPVYLLLHHNGRFLWTSVLTVGYFLLAAFVYLLRKETTVRGLFLLAMLGAELVMMATTIYSYRTAVPGVLLLFTVSASLLAECLQSVPQWGAVAAGAAIVAVCLPSFLPTWQGYAANAAILRENERALQVPGEEVAVLNVDAEFKYRYLMYFESDAYFRNAMYYYGVTDKKVTWTSENRKLAGLYGEKGPGLPVLEEEGTLYFPIVNTVISCGGEGDWNATHLGTWAQIGDRCYVFLLDGAVHELDPVTGELGEQVMTIDLRCPWYTYYVCDEVLEELYGIHWRYQPEENIYYVQQEEMGR